MHVKHMYMYMHMHIIACTKHVYARQWSMFECSLAGYTLLGERESGNYGQTFVMAVSFYVAQKNFNN